jgi:hypothetical protein
MKVKYNGFNRQQDEQFLSLLILGIVGALRESLITCDDAWNWLLNARTLNRLESTEFDKRIIDAIHLGTELDTVKRFVPHVFECSCDEILELAKSKLKELSFRVSDDYLLEIEINKNEGS